MKKINCLKCGKECIVWNTAKFCLDCRNYRYVAKYYKRTKIYECEKNWKLKNTEKLREYRTRWDKKNRHLHKLYNTKYYQKNKVVTSTSNKIINKKKYPVADKCQLCNDTTHRLERHHFDYSKPFEYVTLCNICHRWWHVNYNSLKKNGV